MDTIFLAMLTAALAEIGDKTNFLAMLLAIRFGPRWSVMGAIVLAAAANSLIAAYGGTFVADVMNVRAAGLMTGLAILFVGAGALWPIRKMPTLGRGVGGVFLITLVAFFVQEFGDKTQFVTFALSARMDQPMLAALGATIGISVASIGPVMMGRAWATQLPLKAIRLIIACLLTLIGAWVILKVLVF